jgi:hypothetical protein
MWCDRITCSKCGAGTDTTLLWGMFEYLLPNGSVTYLGRDLGWCFDCKTFRAIENLGVTPTPESLRHQEIKIEEIDQKARQIQKRPLWKKLFTNFEGEIKVLEREREVCSRRLEDLIKRQNLLSIRTSPERCLTCGSTNHIKFALPKESNGKSTEPISVTHPGCGGSLVVQYYAMSINMAFNSKRLYSVEGLFVRAELRARRCDANSE